MHANEDEYWMLSVYGLETPAPSNRILAQLGARRGHSPHSHKFHVTGIPCGCSLEPKTDWLVCECAAAYTDEAISFPFWTCYDCGRVYDMNRPKTRGMQSDRQTHV